MAFKSDRSKSREKAKRAALKAVRRIQRSAALTGVPLSEWEGEFLDSVGGRVEQYGRAFRDPEKGQPGATLSIRQSVKLKEIGAKARLKSKVSAPKNT